VWVAFKNVLKRFLPVPARTHNAQIQYLEKKIGQLDKRIMETLKVSQEILKTSQGIPQTSQEILKTSQETRQTSRELLKTSQGIQKLSQEAEKTSRETLKTSQEILNTSQKTRQTAKETLKISQETEKTSQEILKTSQETLWADIFNSTTIENNPWLFDKTFSPGRWAIGYPGLYVLYRVLRDIKPKRILELGLGETTKLITQYAASDSDVEHFVVEHDPQWIDFFKRSFTLPDNTAIIELPWDYVPYKEQEVARVYKGFEERFATGKYDLICIDGPLGGDMKSYSRIDALSLIPTHLAETFVIMLDDTNRTQEKNTLNEIAEKLKTHEIPFARGSYDGLSNTGVICSENIRFIRRV